jgi:hypothetical protein
MNAQLVHEIRASDCWDGDVEAAYRVSMSSDMTPRVPGLLLVTSQSFYIMEEVSVDDAAIIFEDLLESVTRCIVEDDKTTVHLWTVEGEHFALNVHDEPPNGATQLARHFPCMLRFDDDPTEFATPPPPPRPLFEAAATSVATPAAIDVQADAAALQAELAEQKARLATLLDTAQGASTATIRVELEELSSRMVLTEYALGNVDEVASAERAAWRSLVARESQDAIDDIKQLHCSTAKLDRVLPDGAAAAGLLEVPLNGDVAKLLEQAERAARSTLNTYLTTQQLQARDRRRQLEIDIATRELRIEIAGHVRTIATLRSDLSQLRARCSDLDSACVAMNSQVAEMKLRERSVLERARQREEELHTQLSRSSNGASQADLGLTRRRTAALLKPPTAPVVFDLMSS